MAPRHQKQKSGHQVNGRWTPKPFTNLVQTLLLCALVLFPGWLTPAHAQAPSPLVSFEMLHSFDKYVPGGTYPVKFKISIAEGWKIYGHRKNEEGFISTRLDFEPSSDFKLIGPMFPEPQKMKFDYTTEPVEIFSHEVLVDAWLQIEEAIPASDTVLKGRFTYQACSDTVCRRPKTVPLAIPIAIAGQDEAVTPLNQEFFALSDPMPPSPTKGFLNSWSTSGIWLTLLAIFLGGLALNLTPCIFPLIPITVSYFGGRNKKNRSDTILHAGLYLAGLALTNSILGVSAALSGRMLGTALQTPIVLIAIAAVMVILALSFFGVWDMRLPQFLTQMASKNYQGYFGTFFMGLTLGIVAAPCLGPFILGLLTYVGQTGDPYLGFLYFFVLSIGLGLPLCILAIFTGALDRLPKSGDWMIWVKKLMGWILIGVAVYLLTPLVPPSKIKEGLLFIVFIPAGIHLGWLDKTGRGFKRFPLIKKGIGLILAISGLALLIVIILPKPAVVWTPYHPQAIADARASEKPVIIDFYADWCLPCKKMDHFVFTNSQVIELSKKFLPLRMDLTRRQPDQREILRQYQIRGVPTVIFLNADGLELKALRVEAFVDADEMIVRMKQALETSEKK